MKITALLSTILASAILLLTGCSSIPAGSLGGIRIVEGRSNADLKDFTPDRRKKFEDSLQDELYDRGGGFVRGDKYTLTWTIAKIDEGSRALRFWVGMGAGTSVFNVDVQVTDAQGHLVGKDTVVDFEWRGSDFDNTCEDAGKDTAKAARKIIMGPRK